MVPVILVPADVRPGCLYRRHAVPEPYLTAIAGAGGVPIVLPSLGEATRFDAVLDRVDGVLTTGAPSNLHPSRYGRAVSEQHKPFDEARDATVLKLLRETLARAIPLLAICRGMQELNVALGGTLSAHIQSLPGRLNHSAPESEETDVHFGLTHEVVFEPGARLARMVGADSIRVNSVHSQAVDRLAPGLTVEARAPDGTIEAVRVKGTRAFAYGVQWHPEHWAGRGDAPSTIIMRAFVDAARQRVAERLPAAAQ
jgi:putative glutamine amidotransferase